LNRAATTATRASCGRSVGLKFGAAVAIGA
jgi:hypothetical protein